MKKVLILGVTSNIGYRFYTMYQHRYDLYGTCRKLPDLKMLNVYELNSLSKEKLSMIINEVKPDIVINCIGIGSIDFCELNKEIAKEINFEVVKLLREIGYKAKYIFFSSASIYSGSANLYNEESIPMPLHFYGKLKVEADQYIKQKFDDYLILRPAPIIGVQQSFQRVNPATFIIRKLYQNLSIMLVNDVFSNLLFLDDCIKIMGELIDCDSQGDFNLAGNEIVSRYELGKMIAKAMHKDNGVIKACDSNYFKSLVPRPQNLILDNKKIKCEIGYEPLSISSAIEQIVKEQLNDLRKTLEEEI
ncbi:SDR family oxidoreductase [Sulfurovum sp. ST-21]|uniref:Sugar nucleotide-binding protein n=1 Tax=Sulfurovum indicum TaxID=2779528 RepID=A0A7M1S8G2_9BACT|nr:sugar nucleotide-binding protein [Sulfurovum indicum]QOR62620.1 sugar nucleotide-binding protein [Sulfurovum indicum]